MVPLGRVVTARPEPLPKVPHTNWLKVLRAGRSSLDEPGPKPKPTSGRVGPGRVGLQRGPNPVILGGLRPG
jgi:hypothetical protein